MTEVLKDQNAWTLKDGNVAGPDTDEKPESTDKMQLQVLKELGIETTADLKCLLNSNGISITYQMLEDLQTPYLDYKDTGMWQPVKNPKYAKQEETKNQNKLINAYEEIIKQAFRKNFNESKNISLVKIARGENLPVDHFFLGEVIEVEKSLALLCIEKADDVDFENQLIEWYLTMKKSCTRLNFYF